MEVVLPRVRILLVVGFVVAATPAWSSDKDFRSAESFYRAKRFSEAEKLYRRVDSGSADYPIAQLHLGTIYYLTERPAQAEKCFLTHLNFRESPAVYCLLAGAQFNQKKYDLATSTARKALHLDPQSSKAFTVLGMIHTAENDITEAEADYREALKLNDHDSDTWFMLGRTLFLRDEFPRAATAFERALRIDPNSVRGYDSLARTKDIMGDLKGAEACYEEGLRAGRKQDLVDPHIYVGYGEFLLKLNRLSDSQRVLEEASRVAPDNAQIHYELSKIYFRMARLEDAAREGETALRLGGPDYRVDFLLAQVYTVMGNPQEASRHASRAAQPAPTPNR